QDMRVTAQQVVKDIEAVRGELKRAIVDLPEETRANADAMRRVVADQITALNALADLVKRQSGGFDISGPGFRAPSVREPGSGKSEGTASPAPLNRTSSTQETRIRERSTGGYQAAPLASLKSAPTVSKTAPKPNGELARRTPQIAV